MKDFEEVTLCPYCGEPTSEVFSGDQGATCCPDCGCIEGERLLIAYECQDCHQLCDEPKCECK